jgi:hypothetical protein
MTAAAMMAGVVGSNAKGESIVKYMEVLKKPADLLASAGILYNPFNPSYYSVESFTFTGYRKLRPREYTGYPKLRPRVYTGYRMLRREVYMYIIYTSD